MHGDAAFMKLKEMTPEQRRECQLMWLFDREQVENIASTVVADIQWDHSMSDTYDDELIEQLVDSLTFDEIAAVTVNAVDGIPDDIYYDFWDACVDCLRDQLRMTLEDKLEEHRTIESEWKDE